MRRRPDKLIQLQRRNPTDDTVGARKDNWTSYATAFARVMDKRQGEFDTGEQIQESVDTVFRIRPLAEVEVGHRVLFEGQELYIHEIERDEDREFPVTVGRWIDLVTNTERVS